MTDPGWAGRRSCSLSRPRCSCYFNAIESIPIGLAVLLEYLGVVLIAGWLWAVRVSGPGG